MENSRFKFRAWDKSDKMMKYSEDYENLGTFFSLIDYRKASGVEYEVMQDTGLKDKSEIPIFEGDVVHWDFDKKLKSIIEFRWGCFGYKSFSSEKIKNSDDFIKIDKAKTAKMIIERNIYESELLTNKKE